MRVCSGKVVRLALAATVVVGIVAPSLEAQGRAVIRARTTESGRDSTVDVTVTMDGGDIMRMVAELLASRQLEERLALTIRDLSSDRADAAKLRDLEAQLMSVARRSAGLTSAVKLQCAREAGQPEGYLGVSFVEEIEVRSAGEGAPMYVLGANPRLLSIEPGSPAQRAGLEANDVLLSIGGNDARKPVPLGTLLKPGAKLSVRVLREGRDREFTVNVAKRPDNYGSPCAGLDDMLANARVPQATFLPRTPTRAAPRTSTVIVSEGGTGAEQRFPSSGFVFMTPFAAAGPNLIGGAQFLTLDAQWRETLGVDKGLLVLSVAAGSPAETAGLRKSDVIVAVGDSAVTSVAELWRMVNQSGTDGLTLRVQRARQNVAIVFKPRAPR